MSLFMDVHTMDGAIGINDVAQAIRPISMVRASTTSTTRSTGVDEKNGKIFCLVEAPSAEAAAAVHREAHGLVAGEIYPVTEGK